MIEIDRLYSLLAQTHDLSTAFGDLANAARRYTLPALAKIEPTVIRDLAAASVAFAVQLAIDTGRDPDEMRTLERDLIAKLEAP